MDTGLIRICRILSHRDIMLWLANILLVVLALPAWAELGGDVASIKADQEKMHGALQVTATAAYQIHEIQSAQGVRIREYVTPDGTVFGVSWRGPWKPDLRQLLGQHFDRYVKALQGNKTARGPATIQLPELVVESGGHMRAFFGRAYLPQLIPPGSSADVVQ